MPFPLADASVQCVVTSPAYWGLRDYGIDGQLGLERTPEEYVERLVQVFREVWRVLRDDGTVWLNLGDSYIATRTGGGAVSRSTLGGGKTTQIEAQRRPSKTAAGLKPKDLVGIPWSVAKALQAPYYTGRIRNIEDRIWLACAIDAEGCIFIHKRKAGQDNGQGYKRKTDGFGAGLEVANTSEAFVCRCMEITEQGSICYQDKGRNQRLFRWNLRSNQCRAVLREVYPYLVAKKHEARLAIGCLSSGPKAAEAHESLKKLHNGYNATIDFAAPDSVFESGWYLRSDVIWSKLNPMPESVTDRPTKAHEYLFLLSKQQRYFYDADAIKEPGQDWGTRDRKPGSAFVDSTPGRSKQSGGKNCDFSVGRNRRTVWTIPTQPTPEAHFAAFPDALVEPCVLAGTSAHGACAGCGAPWERVVEHEKRPRGDAFGRKAVGNFDHGQAGTAYSETVSSKTIGWRPTCECSHDRVQPCVVLDPFGGTGTTVKVAQRLGRKGIALELSPEYCRMAREKTWQTARQGQMF